MSYRHPPPNMESMTSLKVDNLNNCTTVNTLLRTFEKYGDIGDVYIPRDRFTKEARGFAFVRFHDKHQAENAKDAINGIILDGHELRVQMARFGRPPNSLHGYRRETPTRTYRRQSHSPSGRHDSSSSSQSRSRGRSRFSKKSPPRCSHMKSASRFHGRSPSTSKSSSTSRFKSSSVSTSSSLTKSRSTSRSVPSEEKSSSQSKDLSTSPKEEGVMS
ncbi:serine/arginine-rich splicing factor 2-like [Pteropus medius]|uniref:serine/arginine-rich splicing factor 2-like n=1 Tax=Pteropus vampyrus TaxID=132908 RepID=UPI00196A3DF9|nr:serine/arginine-rich splicing factor 2-like [Pteropus giganteus]